MTTFRPASALAVAAVAAAFASSGASAQWRYCQPWRLQLDSHESRVASCDQPTPLDRIAWDDWVADEDSKIVVVQWWGVLTNPDAQETPARYRLAIAGNDPASCLPADLLYERCIRPRFKYVGTDCAGMPVYKFRARVPGGFIQQAGGHYWLSISESDADSARPGEEDFRWSGFRRHRYCKAAQQLGGGAWIQPLESVCDERTNDLAFCLYARTVAGQAEMGTAPEGASVELYDPDTGLLAERVPVDIEPDGHFLLTPDVPDGTYEAVLSIPGRVRARATIELQDGEQTVGDWGDVPAGDLDGDGEIGLGDLLIVLANWRGI